MRRSKIRIQARRRFELFQRGVGPARQFEFDAQILV
jgi:hypothetical protein